MANILANTRIGIRINSLIVVFIMGMGVILWQSAQNIDAVCKMPMPNAHNL